MSAQTDAIMSYELNMCTVGLRFALKCSVDFGMGHAAEIKYCWEAVDIAD